MIESILEGRGLWNAAAPLQLTDARALLLAQSDFMAQKEWLVEVVQGIGGKILYYPKFHCELN